MPPKKPLAALAVVDVNRAPKVLAAEGKMALMERVRHLSGDGERVLAALFRVMDNSDNDKNVLAAVELALRYGWGEPIRTTVTADVSQPPPASSGVKSLTTAQLEALASGEVTIEGESEEVQDSSQISNES